eukprot:69438-Prorocentrum_lima.AAC.1
MKDLVESVALALTASRDDGSVEGDRDKLGDNNKLVAEDKLCDAVEPQIMEELGEHSALKGG